MYKVISTCENLCNAGFKSNSINPDRGCFIHIEASNEDRTQLPDDETDGFEGAVFITVIHVVQIRMDIFKLE
jgi:hypothetical protein